MATLQSPPPRYVIVSRLRAAGCVFAEDEAQLLMSAARTPNDLADMVDRRATGLPLEHVLGWAEFYGLRKFWAQASSYPVGAPSTSSVALSHLRDQGLSSSTCAAAGGLVYEGEQYEPLPASLRGRVDILVANAPYVPTEAVALMPPEARVHEPRVARSEELDATVVIGTMPTRPSSSE